jgi:y4mF family transcriptional regulator
MVYIIVLSTFIYMIFLSLFADRTDLSLYVYKRGVSMKVNSALDLAATVRGRRRDLGLSQADLAESAGVSRVWIATVEAGKRSVNFGMVLRLLGALDLTMDISSSSRLSEVFKDVKKTPTPRNRSEAFKGPAVDLDSLLEGYRD